MKRLTIMVAVVGPFAYAHAAPALKLEDIKQIVCESTVSYDKDSPNEKTAARGVKIFKPGSRKDVKRRPGAFLLAEVDTDGDEQDAGYDQQFYFSPIKGSKLSFRFIAEWESPRRAESQSRRYRHRLHQSERPYHRAALQNPPQIARRAVARWATSTDGTTLQQFPGRTSGLRSRGQIQPKRMLALRDGIRIVERYQR